MHSDILPARALISFCSQRVNKSMFNQSGLINRLSAVKLRPIR